MFAKSFPVTDDTPMCDCAGCGRELLGESVRYAAFTWAEQSGGRPPPSVAGRVGGRPYCDGCMTVRKPPPGRATPDDGPGPWGENAVRALEG